MGMGRFISKLHAKSSEKGSIDPNSTKMAITENTSTVIKTEKAVDHVHAPVSVTVTVQAKVDPSSPSHGQTRSSLGEQRHTCTPITKQMEKLPLATDIGDCPSSPIRDHKLHTPTKVEKVNDYGVANNTHDNPKSSVRGHSSRAIVEPVEDYKVIKNKSYNKPLATAPEQRNSSPIKQRNYGVINNDKRDIPSIPVYNSTYSSPRKSYGVIDEKHDSPSNLVHDQGYKFPSTKVDKETHYGSVENKWGNTSSPLQERPEEFVAGQSARPSLLGAKNWRNEYGGEYTNYHNKDLDKPSNGNVRYKQVIDSYEVGGVNRHGMDGGHGANAYGEYANYRNKDLDKPRYDIVTYKQVLRPLVVGKSSEIGGKNWRDTDGADVYGEYANYRYRDMDKPTYDLVRYKQVVGPHDVGKGSEIGGKNWRYSEYTNYSNNYLDTPSNDIVRYEQVVEPYKNRWEWPRKEEWVIPPTQVTPLFGPTNDIGKAVEFLKEAVISAPPPQNINCCTDSRIPFRNTYTGAIDSNEAQRRFGNPSPSARPTYMGTIISTEAARKYGGTPV